MADNLTHSRTKNMARTDNSTDVNCYFWNIMLHFISWISHAYVLNMNCFEWMIKQLILDLAFLYGSLMIWRFMQISEDVICQGRRHKSSQHVQPHLIAVNFWGDYLLVCSHDNKLSGDSLKVLISLMHGFESSSFWSGYLCHFLPF